MYDHNKAQQSKNRVHISWDILYSEYNSIPQYIINNGNYIHWIQH